MNELYCSCVRDTPAHLISSGPRWALIGAIGCDQSSEIDCGFAEATGTWKAEGPTRTIDWSHACPELHMRAGLNMSELDDYNLLVVS